MANNDSTPWWATHSGRFRVVAVAEAVSWVCLLIGMYFKYFSLHNDLGVQVFGMVHGIVFICYVLLSLVVHRPLRWDLRTLAWALLASLPPLGSVVFERWAMRTGRLRTQRQQADPERAPV